MTPFQPKDYNFKRWRFLFSKEYLSALEITTCCDESDSTGSEEHAVTFASQIPVTNEEKQAKSAVLVQIPKPIMTHFNAVINDFEMIKDGDRVLVALSGRKNSMALIYILK